ncbi:3D domain-containing protein [Xylocopilactobacillus apis]|uniref:S-layer protein C-terminal domain-containing protein n=1 Tax=Xylocopilactobacillus apis TaxID=2932183 RepID=A0AAU9CS40_9LACO|nr:3D domain-containing protein [Xylocopilactobacillus apis]BDR56782.1 hypothetical protein KIMC2_13440 [Xylocopilactobacillus apis]
MRVKKTIISLIALTSVSGIANAVSETKIETVQAAAAVAYSAQSGTFYVNYPGYSIAVYKEPADQPVTTGKFLQHGTAWKVSRQALVNKKWYYQVGKNQWVQAAYMSRVKPDISATSGLSGVMYVNYKQNASIAVYSAPANSPKLTGQYLPHRSAWKVFQEATTTNGKHFIKIGANQWVQGDYMSWSQPVVQSAGRTMVATAYDPRVLGNYTFGYDTVAANLSVFPRGTRLAITFQDGTTKNYVVRDTGGFAYSNPNQLDIAMPNSQALQFGRQTVTVRVIS